MSFLSWMRGFRSTPEDRLTTAEEPLPARALHPPGFYPQAIKNKRRRKAAIRWWRETGTVPGPEALRHIK